MKHKLVVAMSLLGLISTPAFADTMHKPKHYKRHHHVVRHDYKAMGGMPVQQAPVAEVSAPVVASSTTSQILDQMNQSVGMNKPMPEWFNRVGVSGGINFDTGKWGSRSISNQAIAAEIDPSAASSYNPAGLSGTKRGYTGENTKRFSINNAYLNVTADINEWTKALAVLSYTDASLYYDQAYTSFLDNTDTNLGQVNQTLTLEQAVISFGNFDCSPVFLQIGRQFQDYGRYTLHPITASMTQSLTESLRNSIKLGFITDMGIHGSAYMFQDGIYKAQDSNNRENTLNYGAALGYAHPDDQLGYDIGIGWMYNMFGVNNVSALFAASDAAPLGYHSRVGSYAAYADVNYEAFSVGLRYTSATQRFSNLDVPRAPTLPGGAPSRGAKPWAFGIQAGYGFNAWSKNQNVYIGYQSSQDTVYFNLPRSRYLIGLRVDALKNTELSAEWDHDNAWNVSSGGPASGNSNLVSVRAAVKFG